MNTRYLKLIIILFGQLLAIMDIFIINVSIPSIQRDIHASNGGMQLVIASYLIGFASFLITGGRLGDLYGRKKIFIIGLVLFMISSLACGLSSSPWVLIISRFVQGISSALMSPQVLSMIQVLFPAHEERTKAMGWYGITIGIGTILGQFLGGYFSSMTAMEEPWRLIFLINVPICLIAVFLGITILKESKTAVKNTFDVAGVALLSLGLFCFTYALTMQEGKDFDYKNIVVLLISLGIIVYFINNQKSKRENNRSYLMDFNLFSYNPFNLGILAVSLFFIMLDSYFYILSIFFQEGLRISPLHSGEAIVFQGLGFILASVFSSKLILKYGKKVLITASSLIIAVLVIQGLVFNTETPFSIICILLFLHGMGVGSIIPSLATIALSKMPETLAGSASGVYITFQQIAALLGIIVVGSIFYYALGQNPSEGDYNRAFCTALFVNIICLAGVVIFILKVPNTILLKKEL